MRRYWEIYLSLFQTSLIADLEFRLNFVLKTITDIIWYLAQMTVFEVLYHHTQQIAGWDLSKARVFMSVLFTMDAIWMVVFHANLDELSYKVRRGELDLLLVKPVHSQFLISLQRQTTSYILNLVVTLTYMIWALSQLPNPVEAWRFLYFIFFAVPSAQLIMYFFRLSFAMLAFIFTNADSVNYIFYQIYRLGMRPDSYYPKWLRYTVLTWLPMAFVASVPTRLLVEEFDLKLAILGPALAVFFLWLSTKLWQRATSRYSSASS